MDAIQMFLNDHSRTHSVSVGNPEGGFSISDFVLSGLDDGQIRLRPGKGLNSLAWLFWHMARTEDMGVNLIIAGRPQVLEEDDWAQRLDISRRDMGAGMADEEVTDFGETVDIAELHEYRSAVGRRTREIVGGMRSEELAETIDSSRIQQALSTGAIGENAGWIEGAFAGKTKALVLGHLASGHSFMHLGEAWCLRSMAGLRLPL